MFRKKGKRKPLAVEVPAPVGPPLVRALLAPIGENAGNPWSGEFIVAPAEGRVIAVACGLPEPWTLEPRGYTGYASFLEEPGSGDRVRMDLTRVGEREWASVRTLASDPSGYTLAYVCPVGEGRTGIPILSGFLAPAVVSG